MYFSATERFLSKCVRAKKEDIESKRFLNLFSQESSLNQSLFKRIILTTFALVNLHEYSPVNTGVII